jgi:hypothetical protein
MLLLLLLLLTHSLTGCTVAHEATEPEEEEKEETLLTNLAIQAGVSFHHLFRARQAS